jgi:hypothetical protein
MKQYSHFMIITIFNKQQNFFVSVLHKTQNDILTFQFEPAKPVMYCQILNTNINI